MKKCFTWLTFGLAALAAWSAGAGVSRAADTVKIGVLHSLSGTMAISETSLRDVVLMAVDEINKAGGVLGKQIEPVVVDPASDWPMFAEKAKELINTRPCGRHFRLLDLGQPQVGAAGV